MEPRKGAVKVIIGNLELRIWKGDSFDITVATIFITLLPLMVVTHIAQNVKNMKTEKSLVTGWNKFVDFFGHVRCLFNILPLLVIRHPSGNQKIKSAMPYGLGAGYRNCDIGIPMSQREVYVFWSLYFKNIQVL